MEHTPHIAMLPSPGISHLIPLTEFAKQLVHCHGFSVTFIISTTEGAPPQAQKTILESLPKSIDHILLPPVTFEERFEGIEVATQVALTTIRSLSSFRGVFKLLMAAKNLVALVVDPFSSDAIDIAKEFEICSYLFFPSSAMTLSWFAYLPKLDEMVSCEYKELCEPVQIPGCIPVHGRDFMDPAQDRKGEAYKWLLHHTKRLSLVEGIILDSFMDLEPAAIKAFQGEQLGKQPVVYPIGPLVRVGSSSGLERDKCLEWLDNQPRGSVLFVAFGSGGTLSCDQLNELALGLEMSVQRFLWVLKGPNNKSVNAAYLSVQNQEDPLGFLPKGFLARIKGRGLVVPNWAPQIDVLSHGATGGFLTHTGWNSIMESVVNGVPLIAWPLYGEQKMIAVVLEDLKVAMRLNDQNGLMGREEIAKLVRALMEGDEGEMIRNRMVELKEAALKALSKDGQSTKSLFDLAQKLKNARSI